MEVSFMLLRLENIRVEEERRALKKKEGKNIDVHFVEFSTHDLKVVFH